MYETININDVIEQAKAIVMKTDRQNYDKHFQIMEKFVIENELVLGGKCGIETVLPVDINKDSYVFDIFIDLSSYDHVYNLSNKLVDELYTKIGNKTICLETNIKFQYFTVWCDGRILARVQALARYRNKYSLVKLIGPELAAARWYAASSPQIQCMGYEIFLMSIYRQLYTPYSSKQEYTTYSKLMEIEKIMYARVADRLYEKSIGGGGSIEDKFYDKFDTLIHKILKAMPYSIVIGDYAVGDEHGRFQFISADRVENICEIINSILSQIYGVLKISVSYEKYDLNIPGDHQLIKYTIYVNGVIADRRIPFCDMFNSTAYECIPWRAAEIFGAKCKVAREYVLLRFKLIDLYAQRLIYAIGKSDERAMQIIIKKTIKFIKNVREKIQNCNDLSCFALTSDEYIGVSVSDAIVRKKMIENIDYRIPRYYPYLKDYSASRSAAGGWNIKNYDNRFDSYQNTQNTQGIQSIQHIDVDDEYGNKYGEYYAAYVQKLE